MEYKSLPCARKMSESEIKMSKKEINYETGAGVGFSEAVENVERVVPTPPISVAQQQEYSTVNMEEGRPFDQGNNFYGHPYGGPLYVRLDESPEEIKRKELKFYAQMAFYLVMLFLILLTGLTSRNAGNNAVQAVLSSSHHTLVEKCDVKFEDVHGCDEIKGQLQKIVEFLKHPSDFTKFNAKMPRGYLLTGLPGVGKTMLAKAVAGESGVAFITISGAEFEEVLVGLGAARVRNLFSDARTHGKAVIFIDEIDAIAGKRNSSGLGDSSTMRQTLNQLLVEMDGFKTGEGIVVLAATNTPESLDPAILRPGRFDKTFKLLPPDINGRAKMLKNLIGKIPEEKREEGDLKNLEVMWLAKITVQYTGADLANLVNHAKLIASGDKNTEIITKKHFFDAKKFVELGPETETAMDAEDLKRTAYHEAGHAIIALINHETSKEYAVEYATIIPHGEALGLVTSVPQRDFSHMTLEMMKQLMDMTFGGFVGEKLLYQKEDKISTGAASDLKKANGIARAIVQAGFGKRTGFVQMTENPAYSSELFKQNFEADMNEFMKESKKRVEGLLKKYEAAWKALAGELLEKKSLNRTDIEGIFKTNSPVISN